MWTGELTVVPFPGELKLMLCEKPATAKSITAATQRKRFFGAEFTCVFEEPVRKVPEWKELLT
jgi:hypothetical protein